MEWMSEDGESSPLSSTVLRSVCVEDEGKKAYFLVSRNNILWKSFCSVIGYLQSELNLDFKRNKEWPKKKKYEKRKGPTYFVKTINACIILHQWALDL